MAELSAGQGSTVVPMGGRSCGSSRYGSLFIVNKPSSRSSPLSPSLARVEGSVTFSRAITQIPNDKETRSFSRFLSLSFLASCVRMRGAAHARIERSPSALVSSAHPSFVSFTSASLSPHLRQSDPFVAPSRHSVTRKPRTPQPASGVSSTNSGRPSALSISRSRRTR